VPRRAKLKPQDFERHVFTAGCPGCQQIQLKSHDRKNHAEERRRRMEGELTKTSEGQNRLDRAKDRLDTKVAEIGQAELDKQAEVDEEHVPDQNIENEDDVAELFGNFDDAPEVERGPQRFDLSPRGSIPKRREENDDMEDDSTDKRLRPRSPTVSYKTDDASVGSNVDMDECDIGMLNEIDRKILSSSIMGVDITEIYSPERVAQVAGKFGLVSGSSMDLTNGWDLFLDDHKRLAWKRVREEAPYLLIGSPPCMYISILQELNKSVQGSKPGWMEKFDKETEKAIKHVNFCSAL
jgi:hypothetical protein